MTRGVSLAMLIGETLVFGLVSLIATFMGAVVAMAFDAPGSDTPGRLALGYTAMFSGFTMPVVFLASIIIGWVLFAKKRHKAGALVGLLPLTNIAVYVLTVALMFTGD